eukprot:1106779-Alexandrium_andersonii.AAC.1
MLGLAQPRPRPSAPTVRRRRTSPALSCGKQRSKPFWRPPPRFLSSPQTCRPKPGFTGQAKGIVSTTSSSLK